MLCDTDIKFTAMLSRKLDNIIERHYVNNKSALLLKGARQVGKTSAIRKYAAKQKMNLIEINFYEDDSACNIFKGSQNAKEYCCVYRLTQKRRHHYQIQ